MALLALLMLVPGQAALADLDDLARNKNVAELTRRVVGLGPGVRSPFQVLATGGAYDVGKFGWRAVELKSPDGSAQYVVFSTPLTSEDTGELLFRLEPPAPGVPARRLRHIPESDTMGIRIESHAIQVAFDLSDKRAELTDQATFLQESGRRGGPFLFRMSPHYRVRTVTDETDRAVRFAQAGGIVMLEAPSAARFTYTIRYGGVVDLPQYAGSVTKKEAFLTNDYWYPMIARLPAPYRLSARIPRGWVAVGQGELVDRTPAGNDEIWTFRMDLPVIYYSFSAAPYRSVATKQGSREYRVWSMAMPEADMRLQSRLYPAIVDFYEGTFHRYPFSGFGACVSEVYGGGALEAYSFATYGTGWLPEEDAHEPAHTWWGGLVNNTYLKSFWNESFAVFSEGLYRREAPIGNRAERRLAFIQDGSASPAYDAAPLVDSGAEIGPAASALGYGKGAQVLQMLETLIGTLPLTMAMELWAKTHPRDKPGEWEDFESILLDVAPSVNPKSFLDDWLRRPGYARFTIDSVEHRGGAVRAMLRFQGRPYRVPLEAMLEYPDGRREFHKIDTGDLRFSPSGAATLSIPAPRKPALVSFDPWRRLVRDIRPDEAPVSIAGKLRQARKYTHPSRRDWMAKVPGTPISSLPANLNGVIVVAPPEASPAVRALFRKVGFVVNGDKLVYDGTTIDLRRGGALAVVDLAEGGQCVLGVGTTLVAPNPGRARLALFDELGRFLRGRTEPKRSGWLTFRLS